MPPESWHHRVGDVIAAIERIRAFTDNMSFEDFWSDMRTNQAVLWNFQIIGEAIRHIPDDVLAAHHDIQWYAIRDMRNILVHAYFRVDNTIVWKTIQKDLDPLLQVMNTIRSNMLGDSVTDGAGEAKAASGD